jgi:hypothetical protein
MRTERTDLDRQVHCYGRGVPPRGGEAFEWSIFGGDFVDVHWLRIKFRCEPFDIALCDLYLTAFEAHPDHKIIEPLNHERPFLCDGIDQRVCLINPSHWQNSL